MRLTLPVLLTAALCTSATAQSQPGPTPQFTVKRVQASPEREEHQVALLMRLDRSSPEAARSWMLERRISSRRWADRATTHEWIDGRDCPALAKVVAAISELPPMKFSGADAQMRIAPFHFPVTTLYGPPAQDQEGGTVRIARTDYTGGVSAWWSRAEKALAGCWRAAPPVVNGAPMRERLGSEEQAELWARPFW